MAKPVVDPDLCIACGLCVDMCPEVFEMGEEHAIVKDDADCDSAGCCQEAAEACPTEAITLPD